MEVCTTTGVPFRLPTNHAVGVMLPRNAAITTTTTKTHHSGVGPSPTLTLSTQQLPPNTPQIASRRDLLVGVLGALSLGLVADVDDHALAAPPPSCELTVAPSGLGFCDTSPGSGLTASKGMLIKANYVGKLEDGKVFDSSYDRGKPLTFKIGVGQVIKGWDEGILGGEGVPPMLAGGKRRLRIPPQLGYGERGAGCRGGSCVIPPNSFLLFDVEFVGKAY